MEWPLKNGSVVLQDALLYENGVHRERNRKLFLITAISIFLLVAGWRSLYFVQNRSHIISWLPVFFFALTLLISLTIAYQLLFKRNWATSVSIKEVKALEVDEEDDNILVKVYLQGGRYKSLRFGSRTHAKEVVNTIRAEGSDVRIKHT
jgi:hypothetical protein